MNILQHPLGIIGGRDAQIILHLVVPCLGKVRNDQTALHHGDLQFQAQHDVQIIGGFVRLNTDEGGFNDVDTLIKSFQADITQLTREDFLQLGVVMFPEGQAAPNQVFPHAGLGFMNGHGSSGCQRGAFVFLGNPLFIKRVPAFVHGAKHGRIEVVLVNTGGDAHIIQSETGGEGMNGFILAAAIPVVAECGDDFDAKIPLTFFGVIQAKEAAFHLGFLANGFDQFNLFGTQAAENFLDFSSF